MPSREVSITGLLPSALVSVALVGLVWLRIYLHVHDLGPTYLRHSLEPVVLIGLYVPDAAVQLVGMPSYVYEVPNYPLNESAWYRSGIVTGVASTAFYYILWLVGWSVSRSLRGRQSDGMPTARKATR